MFLFFIRKLEKHSDTKINLKQKKAIIMKCTQVGWNFNYN